jgi:hypothetical protein
MSFEINVGNTNSNVSTSRLAINSILATLDFQEIVIAISPAKKVTKPMSNRKSDTSKNTEVSWGINFA